MNKLCLMIVLVLLSMMVPIMAQSPQRQTNELSATNANTKNTANKPDGVSGASDGSRYPDKRDSYRKARPYNDRVYSVSEAIKLRDDSYLAVNGSVDYLRFNRHGFLVGFILTDGNRDLYVDLDDDYYYPDLKEGMELTVWGESDYEFGDQEELEADRIEIN